MIGAVRLLGGGSGKAGNDAEGAAGGVRQLFFAFKLSSCLTS